MLGQQGWCEVLRPEGLGRALSLLGLQLGLLTSASADITSVSGQWRGLPQHLSWNGPHLPISKPSAKGIGAQKLGPAKPWGQQIKAAASGMNCLGNTYHKARI